MCLHAMPLTGNFSLEYERGHFNDMTCAVAMMSGSSAFLITMANR